MIVKAGQQVLDPEYGPKIYVDSGLADKYRSVEIDAGALSENLQRDFPELDQSDWDNDIVLVTDKLHRRIGGLTTNALLFRNRSVRFVDSVRKGVSSLFLPINAPTIPSAKWMLAASRGHEVLTVLNLSADQLGRRFPDAFFGPDNPLRLSNILAHELHHTTSHLLANRVYREKEDDVRSHFNQGARIMVAIGTGGALAVGGFFEAVGDASEGLVQHLSGVGAMVAGLALAGTIVHRTAKGDKPSLETKLNLSEPIYGQGENCAQAYALATSDSWRGVVSI